METVLQDGGSDDETRQLLFAYIHFIDEGFGAWMNTVSFSFNFFELSLIS